MNKFKDSKFNIMFLAFIILPSVVLIYNAVNSFIYNISFSAEQIEAINSSAYMHPYISAFMVIFNAVISVALLFTSCFSVKTYKLRKILFILIAVFYFIFFVQNVITYSKEWYGYINGDHHLTSVYWVGIFAITLLAVLYYLLTSILAIKKVISNKSAKTFILLVALCAAAMQFANILLDILVCYEYSASTGVLFNRYLDIKDIVRSAICAYSRFCLIYFGFRNNYFVKGEKVAE